jgi:hypothetical protein
MLPNRWKEVAHRQPDLPPQPSEALRPVQEFFELLLESKALGVGANGRLKGELRDGLSSRGRNEEADE